MGAQWLYTVMSMKTSRKTSHWFASSFSSKGDFGCACVETYLPRSRMTALPLGDVESSSLHSALWLPSESPSSRRNGKKCRYRSGYCAAMASMWATTTRKSCVARASGRERGPRRQACRPPTSGPRRPAPAAHVFFFFTLARALGRER